MPVTATEFLSHDEAGTNPDGSVRRSYVYNGPEGGGVLFTGPVSATVQLKDGSVYDLAPPVIAHAPGHLGPLLHHIEILQETAGRLGPDTAHACSDACGDEVIPARQAAPGPAA